MQRCRVFAPGTLHLWEFQVQLQHSCGGATQQTGASMGIGSCSDTAVGSWTDYSVLSVSRASLVAQMVKNLPAMQGTWVGKIPWRRA